MFTHAEAQGFTLARVDGVIVPIEPPPKLLKSREHSIDLLIYLGSVTELDDVILTRALAFGDGIVRYHKGAPRPDGTKDEIASTERICTQCGTGIVCTTYFTANFCVPECTENDHCPTERSTAPSSGPWKRLSCDLATGRCQP